MNNGIKEEVFDMISKIENESTVPKNIKIKMQNMILDLKEEEKELDFRINKALQELDEISEDANLPDYVRTQIWAIVSVLESIE